MARPGRGNIACTAHRQERLLWMVAHGTTVKDAARAVGMSDVAVYRHTRRDHRFRRALTDALRAYPMRGRRPKAAV